MNTTYMPLSSLSSLISLQLSAAQTKWTYQKDLLDSKLKMHNDAYTLRFER